MTSPPARASVTSGRFFVNATVLVGAAAVAYLVATSGSDGTAADAIDNAFPGLDRGPIGYLLTSLVWLGLAAATTARTFDPTNDVLRYQLLRFGSWCAWTIRRGLRSVPTYLIALGVWAAVALAIARARHPDGPWVFSLNAADSVGNLAAVGVLQLSLYGDLIVFVGVLTHSRLAPMLVILVLAIVGAARFALHLTLFPVGMPFSDGEPLSGSLIALKAGVLASSIALLVLVSSTARHLGLIEI